MLSKGKSLSDETVQYTDWEFNQVIGKKEFLDATEFYKDGKVVSKEAVMEEVSKAEVANAAAAAGGTP